MSGGGLNTLHKPPISIGITAYNAAASIERAVVSALAQDWRPLEVVVVDDSSSDDTPAILSQLVAAHPKLRVFRNERNRGVAASRNRIIEQARGEFLAFFDDDDVSLPERLDIQYRRITSYEAYHAKGAPVICHSAREQHFPDGRRHHVPTMGEDVGRVAPHGRAVAEHILLGRPLDGGHGACPTCSQMARLSLYQNLGGFDEDLRRSEDTDLNIRLALSGGHFVGIGRALVIQTMTHTSDKTLDEEEANLMRVLDKHREFFKTTGEYDFTLAWLSAKFLYLRGQRLHFTLGLASLLLKHPQMSLRRMRAALPGLESNHVFSRFHTTIDSSHDGESGHGR